jgi:DNA topoisomerase IA
MTTGKTVAPSPITESELISDMDKHGKVDAIVTF